ncbi:MAG: hypothetical protein CFE24_09800 [Flavobacterium sp. BFFFF2]|nr:MAG: hypothetical protein CFE24_09800 [Flavobacterium sp. BFFFF2]
MKPIILSCNLIKQGLFILLFISTAPILHAQSWVWGKSGGGYDELSTGAQQRQEEVYSIVTDSQGNSYVLSAVSKTGLSIDGHSKTNYSDDTTKADMALTSFACDGSYRWSKIFGGGGYERIHPLQIDAQDNVYVAGRFGSCGIATVAYPPRIDNDIILTATPTNCRLHFITKFNSNGETIWFKQPQQAGLPSSENSKSASLGFSVDALGNSYWLMVLPQGTYADGAFTNALTNFNFNNVNSTYFILKYDTTGAFVSATPLNIQSAGIYGADMQFYRNANNGNFYLFTTNFNNPTATFTIDGQTVTNSMLLACLNPQGQLLWLRQNTTSSWGDTFIHNLAFDADNNIYFSGQGNSNTDVFLGLNVPGQWQVDGFVAKVNSTADTLLWSIYNNNLGARFGAITVNNNEVAVTTNCFSANYMWGNQSIAVNGVNQGTQVLLARFNKDTGSCLGLVNLPNNNAGYTDYGTAIATDPAGDYLVGGGFGNFLYFDNNVSVLNSAAQTDFFLAKYAAHACTLGTPSTSSATAVLYPSPANNQLWIYGFDTARYQIYGLSGSLLLEGTYNGQQPIDSSPLANGCYLLQIIHNDGQKSTHKLLIQH